MTCKNSSWQYSTVFDNLCSLYLPLSTLLNISPIWHYNFYPVALDLDSLPAVTAVLQLWLRSVCLLPSTQIVRRPPRFLGVWCWTPQLPQRYFEWMLKFYFWGKDKYKECQMLPWCWLHFLLFSLETWLKLSLPWFNITCFLEFCLAHGRHSNVAKDESKL